MRSDAKGGGDFRTEQDRAGERRVGRIWGEGVSVGSRVIVRGYHWGALGRAGGQGPSWWGSGHSHGGWGAWPGCQTAGRDTGVFELGGEGGGPGDPAGRGWLGPRLFEAGMGRGHRRRGPHGQPGESDAGERELGEEMALRGEHPRGSSRAAPQPGRWVEAEGGVSPHGGWRGGCLRLLGGWGDTGRGAQTPELIPLGSEGRRPDMQVRLLPRLEGRLTAPWFALHSGLALKPGGGCLKRISCLFDRNFQRHVLM